ncbi:MAG: hypothetical protein E7L40_04940 [Corynebacterium kroppenstedtii]|nr:hypothetical protein [Corynebacterium kroppenstedtii]
MIVNIIISILIVIAAIAFIDEVIEMWWQPDALTRVNLTCPISVIVVFCSEPVGKFQSSCGMLHTTSCWCCRIAIVACLMVASVGSFVMGRSVHAEQIRRGHSATMGKGAGYTGKATTTTGTPLDGQAGGD